MCGVGLFLAADNDPLFLQVKEARASVLEPYAGKSLHSNHGQRVIIGQHLMQTASDVFLGWTRGKNGRHFYIRQLRDMKLSAVIEDWDTGMLRQYGRMCAHALARAHARSGDAAMIAGYMGSGQTFDDAICEFATEYCSQNRNDYRAFLAAIREGRIEARMEQEYVRTPLLRNSTQEEPAGCIRHQACGASMGHCAYDLRFRTGGVILRALSAKAGELP